MLLRRASTSFPNLFSKDRCSVFSLHHRVCASLVAKWSVRSGQGPIPAIEELVLRFLLHFQRTAELSDIDNTYTVRIRRAIYLHSNEESQRSEVASFIVYAFPVFFFAFLTCFSTFSCSILLFRCAPMKYSSNTVHY